MHEKMNIDVSKIHWEFWQKTFAYDYGDGYVCLFDSGIVESRNISGIFYRVGHFSIYKQFKMSTGKMGINPAKQLHRIFSTDNANLVSEDLFNARGIGSVYEAYFKEKEAISTP